MNIIKKALFTSVGLAVMSKEKIESLVDDMIKAGELSEKEGKEFVDELLVRSEEARNRLETKVDQIVHKTIEKANLATRDDIQELTARIERLEQKQGEGGQ